MPENKAEKKTGMRVLFITQAPANRSVSSGNTLLNVMENFDGVEIRGIQTRSGVPDPVMTRCFCITEQSLLRSFLKRTPSGKAFVPAEREPPSKDSAESRIHNFAHNHRWTVLFWARAMVWRICRWRTRELREYLESYDPEIIFTPLSDIPYLNRLILHAAKLTSAKLVVFAWDNNYSAKKFMLSPLRWIKLWLDRIPMRQVAKRADQLYVISPGMKEEYERAFRRPCTVLTKGGDFSAEPALKGEYGKPLQLVYTGNIQNGRWRSLAVIASVLERINCGGVRAQLRIYTGNIPTARMSRALNRGESSFIMGSVPAAEVAALQEQADLLVHVEATNLKDRLDVRQSFSTKIVDYLAASRPVLVYGPKDVASVRHFIDNDCGLVADSPDELYGRLAEVLEDPAALDGLARRAYACGKRHHDRDGIRRMLRKDFGRLLNREL